jgi:hypothetical protein
MKLDISGSSISVNGVRYSGNNITITNDKVIIDGVEQSQTLVGPITVNVEGNCGDIETGSGDVNVSGSSGNVQTGSGKVKCQDVKGNVQTGSGNVNCGKVSGNVRTGSGDINHG